MSLIYDNVIFDLDGVIIDNSAGIYATILYACDKLNIQRPDGETLKKFIGPSLKFSFKEYMHLPPEVVDAAVDCYRAEYGKTGIFNFKLYEGVEETLIKLKELGIRCTIASGKLQKSVEKITIKAGIFDYFDKICAYDAPPSVSDKTDKIREAIVGNRPIMVGDRIFDVEGAYKLGLDAVFALYGFGSPDEIKAYHSAFKINRISELIGLLTK